MRILSQASQEGTIDLPYEIIGIVRNNTKIIATPIADSNPQDRYWILAEYSTETKAIEAIKMLHDKHIGKDKNIIKKTNIKMSSTDNFYFQFPTDDEMEMEYGLYE